MKQNTELRLAKYTPVHTCFEGGETEKEIEAIKDALGDNGYARCGGRTSGCDEHHFFKGLAGVLSGEIKKKSSYLAPGTNQSI